MLSNEGVKNLEFKIGDKVRVLVDSDGIDTIDLRIPYKVFNFIEFENRIGIKNGKYWYYLKPTELELW